MVLEIIFIILVMFAAFLAVCGVGAIIALMMAEENRQVCRNCKHYDAQMSCCWKKFMKVIPGESCKNFEKAKEE